MPSPPLTPFLLSACVTIRNTQVHILFVSAVRSGIGPVAKTTRSSVEGVSAEDNKDCASFFFVFVAMPKECVEIFRAIKTSYLKYTE